MTGIDRRQFAQLGAAAALGALTMGAGVSSAAKQAAPAADPMSYIDPELRPAAERVLEMMGDREGFSDKTLKKWRDGGGPPAQPHLPGISVSEERIPGAAGAPDVTIYVINAEAGANKPAILHTHGGGYILGSAKGEVRYLQEIARDLDCVIVSVEYRLAPETRYTGSIEDNYAGLLWLYENAESLGADRSRIAVMGESAGGGHAALLAIVARDRDVVPLVLQVLVYPMLDDRTGSSRQVPPHIGAIGWDAKSNKYGWESFLGQAPGGRNVPAAGVPARLEKLEGLAPAFIGVGGVDLFVSEDIDYARRLTEAGVATELLVVPGAFHGFDRVAAEAPASQRFTKAKLNALRRAFGQPAQ